MLRKGMMALVRRAVGSKPCRDGAERRVGKVPLQQVPHPGQIREVTQLAIALPEARENRSEERRVGNEYLSTCKYRCALYHYKKKTTFKREGEYDDTFYS